MEYNFVRPEQLQQYFEKLLEDAHITPAPELKEMMIKDLEERLNTRFLQVLAEQLEAEDLETFSDKAVEDPSAAEEFLMSKINNLPELFLATMAEFRQMFLSA